MGHLGISSLLATGPTGFVSSSLSISEFLFCFSRGLPDCAQVFLQALHSGITPGGIKRASCGTGFEPRLPACKTSAPPRCTYTRSPKLEVAHTLAK